MFSRTKPAAHVEHVSTEKAPSGIEISALNEALRHLLAGEYKTILDGKDELSHALQPMVKELRKKGAERLKDLVHMWVEQTAPILSIAEMLRDMRDLEQRNQAMATASEEMAASISEVSRSASLVSQDSQTVKQDLAESVGTVSKAGDTMNSISSAFDALTEKVHVLDKASEQIASILKTIEQIASQTNLLALNATIEAARAGDAGKGFAVVASEVKTLAQQTSTATDDIRHRITSLQEGMSDMLTSMNDGTNRVAEGSEAIKNVGAGITAVDGRVDSVAEKMLTVSSTVEEQTKVTSEVASNIAAVVPMAERMLTSIDMLTDTIEKSGFFIQDQLAECAKNLDPSTIVLIAKSDHASFKKKVVDALVGHGHTTSSDLPDHHNCRLGKWYSSITDETIRSLPAFLNLNDPHERVHKLGKKVLDLHASGDFAAALEEAKKLDSASMEVMIRLDTLYQKIADE